VYPTLTSIFQVILDFRGLDSREHDGPHRFSACHSYYDLDNLSIELTNRSTMIE